MDTLPPKPCNRSRRELDRLLEKHASDPATFACFFRRERGGIVCLSCGAAVGAHTNTDDGHVVVVGSAVEVSPVAPPVPSAAPAVSAADGRSAGARAPPLPPGVVHVPDGGYDELAIDDGGRDAHLGRTGIRRDCGGWQVKFGCATVCLAVCVPVGTLMFTVLALDAHHWAYATGITLVAVACFFSLVAGFMMTFDEAFLVRIYHRRDGASFAQRRMTVRRAHMFRLALCGWCADPAPTEYGVIDVAKIDVEYGWRSTRGINCVVARMGDGTVVPLHQGYDASEEWRAYLRPDAPSILR